MKYYIIDFSSVRLNGFRGMENLSEGDNIIIFYIRGESAVDFSFLSKLYACGAKITMKEVEEKSTMPFAVAMYIGRIIGENSDIFLICNDGESYIKASEIVFNDSVGIRIQQNISGTETPSATAPEYEEAEEFC